jgi:hypothetical protein
MKRPAVFALAIVLASALVGCIQGGPPHNVQLTVSNASGYPATVKWVSPGLFGLPLFPSTGEQPVGSCSLYITAFGPGRHTISVSANGNSIELTLDGVAGEERQSYVLIDESGRPSDSDLASLPSTGCGHV